MSESHRKAAGIVFLCLFVALTLLIDFFHVEKTPKANPSCPACQFHSSSLATQAVPYLYRPVIDFIEVVETTIFLSYDRLVSIDLSPRGPPQA